MEEAKAAGMLVVSSSIDESHGLFFHGMGRSPLSDPEEFESYGPGYWWVDSFFEGWDTTGWLMIPMDSRTTAAPDGADAYVFYRFGGLSWAIPYVAGVYALAAQVDPTITPDRFWSLALDIGRMIELERGGVTKVFGPIVDPVALVDALRSE